MKRILLEVFLVAALIGASVFGFMNQKQASVAKAKITELTAAAEAAEKTAKEQEESLKAAEEEMKALLAEIPPLEEKANQLEAVKAALASGSSLSDLENAYKKEKNLSAERQAGLGAWRAWCLKAWRYIGRSRHGFCRRWCAIGISGCKTSA